MRFKKQDAPPAPVELQATADFSVVAENPDDYYESPAAILADADLTCEEKQRLLEEWARDLELMLNADNEGMAPASEAQSDRDSERLRAANTALRILRGEEPAAQPPDHAKTSAIGRMWRRILR